MVDGSGLSRREILQKCLALGSVTLMAAHGSAAMLLAFEEKELRKPTPANELGPFYKKRAPETAMLRASGDPGMPLSVSGQILDTRGEKLPNAVVEIWQTDHLGHYDLDGYRYRAKLPADGSGNYKFESVMPGHYPDRVCSISIIWSRRRDTSRWSRNFTLRPIRCLRAIPTRISIAIR